MGVSRFYRNEERIEVIIRDESGAKIETLTCSRKDRKKYSFILRYLKEKYGFEPEIKQFGKEQEVEWW